MTAAEARYYRVSRGCHAAWLRTQPQLVIEGVLEQADAGTVAHQATASAYSSAALFGARRSTHLPGRGSRSLTPQEDK